MTRDVEELSTRRSVPPARCEASRERTETISENTHDPAWRDQPDGSRVRRSNGIRIVDRSTQGGDGKAPESEVEHLVTWQEEGGAVVVLGVDETCRPVYLTTLYSYL